LLQQKQAFAGAGRLFQIRARQLAVAWLIADDDDE